MGFAADMVCLLRLAIAVVSAFLIMLLSRSTRVAIALLLLVSSCTEFRVSTTTVKGKQYAKCHGTSVQPGTTCRDSEVVFRPLAWD